MREEMGMKKEMEWVLDESKATRGARFVLFYFAYVCSQQGLVADTINEMAGDLRLARQSVSNALMRLVKLGDIVPVEKDGRSMVYRLACFNEAGEFIGVDSKEAA
jgi:DNA-binding transcriptional ArsR family regulator